MADTRNPPMDFLMNLEFGMLQVPLMGLPDSARELLSQGLNRRLIVKTDDDVVRDYRGLADFLDLNFAEIYHLGTEEDPTEILLRRWEKISDASIGKLIYFLKRMERYDILDDLKTNLEKNIFKLMKFVSPRECHTDETREATAKAAEAGLRLVTRPSWGAYYPRQSGNLAVSPVKVVFIHHTVTSARFPYRDVLGIQVTKILLYGHDDVVSNMMVAPDGTIFEGRGWDRSGSHTARYNFVSISIGLIGNYELNEVDPRMLDAAQKLIEYGVQLGKIDPDHGVYLHCDASQTQSPGKHVIEAVKKWPRFHALGPLPTPQQLLAFAEENNKVDQKHGVKKSDTDNEISTATETQASENLDQTQNESTQKTEDNEILPKLKIEPSIRLDSGSKRYVVSPEVRESLLGESEFRFNDKILGDLRDAVEQIEKQDLCCEVENCLLEPDKNNLSPSLKRLDSKSSNASSQFDSGIFSS